MAVNRGSYKGGGPGNELRQLATDLYALSPQLRAGLVPVFKKAAQNIKNDWQENLRGSVYFAQLQKVISYDDLSGGDDEIVFEIGTPPSPHKPKASEIGRAARDALKNPKDSGGLVHISQGYTSRGGGSRTDPIEFMETEAERLNSEIDKVVASLLGG